jgi:hypothetical protein
MGFRCRVTPVSNRLQNDKHRAVEKFSIARQVIVCAPCPHLVLHEVQYFA